MLGKVILSLILTQLQGLHIDTLEQDVKIDNQEEKQELMKMMSQIKGLLEDNNKAMMAIEKSKGAALKKRIAAEEQQGNALKKELAGMKEARAMAKSAVKEAKQMEEKAAKDADAEPVG